MREIPVSTIERTLEPPKALLSSFLRLLAFFCLASTMASGQLPDRVSFAELELEHEHEQVPVSAFEIGGGHMRAN